MAAIRVKPVEHRVQVQSLLLSRSENSKNARKCLFGSPQPGETEKLFKREQANNLKKLFNYKLVTYRDEFEPVFNSGLRSSEDPKQTIKRVGSTLTDHFKITKKVRKSNQPTLMKLADENASDVEQCTTESCEIGSTNFVLNTAPSDSALEADVIRTDESLPPSHQQYEEEAQEEVTSHIMVTNYAGKFS